MLIRFLLFWTSYTPLLVIAALRFEGTALRTASAALASLGVLAGLWVLRRRQRGVSPQPHELVSVRDEGPQVAGYLATYLLPFVTVSQPSAWDLAAYLVFVTVLLTVYMRTDLVQMNPMLYVLGYRVFAVTTASGLTAYVISRRRLRPGDELCTVGVAGSVVLDHQSRMTERMTSE
jgi:hypothetical protein